MEGPGLQVLACLPAGRQVGPNLQLLGTREPEIYGKTTLAQIHSHLKARGKELGVKVDARQTNHEGKLCDWIAEVKATQL